MPNSQSAEWILRLVTSTDRAASTVGDLVEEAPARGAIWFWSRVLRTAASLLWREFTERPGRVAGMAFLGFAVDMGVSALLAFLAGLLFFLMAYRGGQAQVGAGVVRVYTLVPSVITSLVIGRMAARWAAGREIAVSLAYVVLVSAAYLVEIAYFGGRFGVPAVLGLTLAYALPRTAALAGAAWGRHRRLASR